MLPFTHRIAESSNVKQDLQAWLMAMCHRYSWRHTCVLRLRLTRHLHLTSNCQNHFFTKLFFNINSALKWGSGGMKGIEWRDSLVALRTWRASEGIMCLNRNGSLSSAVQPLWEVPYNERKVKKNERNYHNHRWKTGVAE